MRVQARSTLRIAISPSQRLARAMEGRCQSMSTASWGGATNLVAWLQDGPGVAPTRYDEHVTSRTDTDGLSPSKRP